MLSIYDNKIMYLHNNKYYSTIIFCSYLMSFLRTSKRLLFTLFFLCIVIFSCKKNSDTSTNTTTNNTGLYDFKFWNTMAGVITNFQSNTNLLNEYWNFGDGTTLNVAGAPYSSVVNHTYNAPGLYTITLVVNNDSTHAVKKQITIQPNFAFYYTGTPIIGDTIFFHFYAYLPLGVSYQWTFGDGTSSTDSIPYHIYNGSGNFTVKLTINNNPANPDLYQVIAITKDPLYTRRITNIRVWHGILHTGYYSGTPNYYTSLPDSTFAITYVNEATLSYQWDTYTYSPTLSTGNTIVFSNNHIDGYFPKKITASTITYNFVSDSISFYYYVGEVSDSNRVLNSEQDITWSTP